MTERVRDDDELRLLEYISSTNTEDNVETRRQGGKGDRVVGGNDER